MIHEQSRGLLVLILCASGFGGLLSPVCAQDQPVQQNEIQAVFRMSKRFLDDLTDDEIVADVPVRTTINGFCCTGVVHGAGSLTVDLQGSANAATFCVESQGNGQACITGVRGPVVAAGPAWGPFLSRTLVQFDGRKFTHLKTVPWARVHGSVQRVTNRRDGPAGRLFGRGMQRIGKHLIPRAEAEAKPIAEQYLDEFVEDLASQIIEKLNDRTPIEESVNRLFPETTDWVFQMSADDKFIQAAFGPPDAPVPALPEISNRMEEVRLEAWLHSTGEEARLLADLSKQPLARQLVQRYIESTLPKLAALTKERTVTAVGDWVVISIGAPPTEDADAAIPDTSRIIDRIRAD